METDTSDIKQFKHQMRWIFFIITLTWFVPNECFANDTVKLVKPISLDKIGREYAPGYLLVEYKDFQVGYSPAYGLFNFFSYSHDKYSQVYFRNSNFEVYEGIENLFLPENQSGFFVMDSCNIQNLPIINSSGNIIIASSQLNFLNVEKTNSLSLVLSGDSSLKFLLLQNNRDMKFQLNQLSFSDSSEVRIFNTTFSEFSFAYDRRSGCNIYFQNDTINSFNGIRMTNDEKELGNYKSWYKYKNVFTFFDCHINADFTFFEQIPNSTFVFNRCTFSPKAYLGDMAADRLIIRNCRNISEQLLIGFREGNDKTELGLSNSDFNNLRFNLTTGTKLIFDSNESRDDINNTYKVLLEKFNDEGKERSYKIVELQYRKYKQNTVWHFLNSIWWYHGYMPGLVFVWTIGLLLSFFLLNLRYWTQIHEAYPIVDGQKAESFKRKNQNGRFYSIVLLYTILIFFSLRVNFDRLKFKRVGFVYILLGQYIIGLWCLLFIIRFVFKL